MRAPVEVICEEPLITVFPDAEAPLESMGNIDVEVAVDGERWGGTIFTTADLANQLRRSADSGDGPFFWASGMVVTESLTRHTVVMTVMGLIAAAQLRLAFVRLEDGAAAG